MFEERFARQKTATHIKTCLIVILQPLFTKTKILFSDLNPWPKEALKSITYLALRIYRRYRLQPHSLPRSGMACKVLELLPIQSKPRKCAPPWSHQCQMPAHINKKQFNGTNEKEYPKVKQSGHTWNYQTHSVSCSIYE